MAEEEYEIVSLQDDFYRDNYKKVIFILISIFAAFGLLLATSIYLYLDKPPPLVFLVNNDWRIRSPVPIDQPHLSQPDLLQWVTDAISTVFIFDFVNYQTQLKNNYKFFTTDGWKVYLNQLNIYANYNNVQAYKLFVNGTPAGAPYVIKEGLLSGRYAWWVQIPINLSYAGIAPLPNKVLTLQILVVRVPTLINLSGVGIDNIIVAKSTLLNPMAG